MWIVFAEGFFTDMLLDLQGKFRIDEKDVTKVVTTSYL